MTGTLDNTDCTVLIEPHNNKAELVSVFSSVGYGIDEIDDGGKEFLVATPANC